VIRILEKIVGINGDRELQRILDEGYEFIARTQNGDFYRKRSHYIIYDPRVDEVIKTFKTKKVNGYSAK
jgi:hypothetical protein